MKFKFPIYLLAALLSTFAFSCNESENYDDEGIIDPSLYAVYVTSFSLQADDSVLVDMDSVFFAIDLDNARVFNPDSLPKGTKTDSLKISLGLSAVSKAEITMPGSDGADTVVNFLADDSQYINFSRGSVKLHLVSYNAEVERDYTILVNVHKLDPDSLSWGDAALMNLPTNLSAVTAQRTVDYQGKALCFTTDGANYCRAESSDIFYGQFSKTSVSMPAGVKLETLSAGADRLYVVAGDALYQSTDEGDTWTATGASMINIYGCIGNTAVGVKHGSTGYTHVTYPASTEQAVDEGCPIEQTSPALVYTTEWATNSQMMIVGGVTASGTTVGTAWVYDGTQWANVSLSQLPAVRGAMIVPYFSFKTATDWEVTRQSILLAIGGITADNNTMPTYISYDAGMHWEKASSLMQLPTELVPGAGAQALVFDATLPSRSAQNWTATQLPTLPRWLVVESAAAASRATKPITEWECPYIYIFGGEDAQGSLSTKVWRGVINRLSFRPLQ